MTTNDRPATARARAPLPPLVPGGALICCSLALLLASFGINTLDLLVPILVVGAAGFIVLGVGFIMLARRQEEEAGAMGLFCVGALLCILTILSIGAFLSI